jgi:hypothetical protein
MEDRTAAAIAAAFDWTIMMVLRGEDAQPSPDLPAEDLAVARYRIALLQAQGTSRALELIAAVDAAMRVTDAKTQEEGTQIAGARRSRPGRAKLSKRPRSG